MTMTLEQYYNGLIRAVVEVTVRNNIIDRVIITNHRNGMGEEAERIIDYVLGEQTLQVDAITTATRSSETILAAIENALRQGLD
ncbi:MAG: FMN-binding protein [Oscillospiraceae bacterium]|nr:FMN-binding protein [Oscillospiraceae bacterium]